MTSQILPFPKENAHFASLILQCLFVLTKIGAPMTL